MFIWGSKTKIGEQEDVNKKCIHCSSGSMTLTMHHKVFTLYYLSIFPHSRSYILECNKCQAQYNPASYNLDDKTRCMKYSRWNFIGLWIIAAILLFAYVSGQSDEADITKYKQQPQIGDNVVFFDKAEKYPYGYFKIIDLNKDEFIVRFNKHVYTKGNKAQSAAKKIVQDNLDDVSYVLSKKELDQLDIKYWIHKK